MKIRKLTSGSASKLLSASKTTFKQWVREEYTLPDQIFYKLCSLCPALSIYEKCVKKRLADNWGQIKGGKSRISKIENLEGLMAKIRKARKVKRFNMASSIKNGMKMENDILDNLLKDGVDLKSVLATCLLTDGSLYKEGNNYRISYYTKDEILRRFMNALLFKLSDFLPTEAFDKKGIYVIRVTDGNLTLKLLKLSPNYKKSPKKGQSKENYLNEIQPTLGFLNKCSSTTVKWCIRFAFTTDGCISIRKNGRAVLYLACYHPVVAQQWGDMLQKYGILSRIVKSRASWCGISGVIVYDLNSIKRFYEIGGFIDGVKVTNKSKIYRGMVKNTLLERFVRGV